MGHDIFGFNKKDKEIAYARYSMWNDNAILLYKALDSVDHYAGVSGDGTIKTFTVEQLKKATEYVERHTKDIYNNLDEAVKVEEFIHNCYKVAKDEGEIKVYFG